MWQMIATLNLLPVANCAIGTPKGHPPATLNAAGTHLRFCPLAEKATPQFFLCCVLSVRMLCYSDTPLWCNGIGFAWFDG